MQPTANTTAVPCANAAPEPKTFPTSDADFAALPPSWQFHDLEKFRFAPHRVRETVRIPTFGSFVEYLAKYHLADSVVFVSPALTDLHGNTALATAVIDYHEPDKEDGVDAIMPRWCAHTVEYRPVASPAYRLLCDLDGKLLAQDEFAQRLRDLARFCTSHAAADLLEVVRTLTLTSRGEFASLNDDISGSVRLAYDVQVDARAGSAQRTLEVPREIKFAVPVLLGDETPTDIAAELLYRTPKQAGGAVQLGIRLPDRIWTENDLIDKVAKSIGVATGLLTIVGTRT